MAIKSLRNCRLGTQAHIGDDIDLTSCDLRDFEDIDRLRFASNKPFTRDGFIGASVDIGARESMSERESALILRQLRHSLEAQGNRPGAGAFYEAEMKARFRAAMNPIRVIDIVVLGGYRVFSGFGLRPLRSLLWFCAFAMVGALLFGLDGLSSAQLESSYEERFQLSVRSMVSFLRPPDQNLTTDELWIQLSLRFIGPLLLAQFLIALRERVAR